MPMPYRTTAIIAVTIVAVLAGLLVLGLWVLSRSFSYSDIVKLPLPHQIGGTVPVHVDIKAKLDFSEVALSTSLTLRIDAEDVDDLLPEKDFSLLLQDIESDSIASMLGRLAFVPETAVVQGANGQITVGTGVSGEFYVRERRSFQRDEEQPDPGDTLPYTGSAVLTMQGIRLDPSWQLIVEHKLLEVQLDGPTRAAWSGRFGPGDYLANLVEDTLNQRGNEMLAKAEASSGGLREKLEEVITLHAQQELEEGWGHFQVEWIEVDNCPVVDEEGSVSFTMAAKARLLEIALPVLVLPDLTVRPGPCTS